MQQNLQQFKIIDKSFKIKQTTKYHLTIKFTETGLNYCIYDPATQRYVVLSNHENLSPFTYDKEIAADELLKLPYAKLRIIVPSDEHTIIPNEYFEQKNLNDYVSLNFSKKEGRVMTNDIPSLNATQIFTLNEKIEQIIHKYFEGALIFFEGTPLLEGLIRQSSHTEKQLLYIHVVKNCLQMAVFDNGKLQLYNRFEYRSAEEFIYFPLYVCNTLGLDPKDLHVFMLGAIRPGDDSYRLIHEHFRRISFGELSKELFFSKVMTQIPQHRFYSLLNIELCA
ncbi:hypothetical protein C3K47_04525 [Solitalea longa]|uniref:DUF3822 domain-containing protein n=1 Tax=Solitalea longa TaxID=2079460 RepID=A0A2S5A5L1_9SPHI|nr:DUF3822 family protein [Solitalea longa]POY37804.1 hypothetical protein C3K47_04525 [Solitalea longa]